LSFLPSSIPFTFCSCFFFFCFSHFILWGTLSEAHRCVVVPFC
jgi:hypothetical protein